MNHSYIFTLTVLTCVLVGHGLVTARRMFPDYVWKFQQSRDTQKTVLNLERQRHPFSSLLLHGAPMQNFNKLSGSFKFGKCKDSGPGQQIIDVKSFSVEPDPVHTPGKISFSFDIVFHETISSSENITVALEVYAEAAGKWLKLPCLGQVGSCTYVDFCQVIAGNSCPQEFKEKGIPCRCPFEKGTYKLNDFSVEILAAVLLPDNYKAKVQVSSDLKGKIACYDMELTAD